MVYICQCLTRSNLFRNAVFLQTTVKYKLTSTLLVSNSPFTKAAEASDRSTTIAELRVCRPTVRFRTQLERYHTPKNLSIALGVEVAELQEHFQWWDDSEVAEILNKPEELREVGEEIAELFPPTFSVS